MSMTTISVSRQVKSKMDEIKGRNGHTSHDSVLRSLLLKDVGIKVECDQSGCEKNYSGVCKPLMGEAVTMMREDLTIHPSFPAPYCNSFRSKEKSIMTPVKLPEMKRQEP